MHIPDNYLSPSTCAVMVTAMIPVWTHSIKKIKIEFLKEKIPLLGMGSAFSFLSMMFNVPLPGGTTGHAVGGTLIAILLGPEAACISVTIALLIQALLFGDGGILSFGANCFNMAFILPFTGYGIYQMIRSRFSSERSQLVAAAVGSYLGINIAAFMAAVEFGIQPILFKDASGQALYCPYSLSVSIPAMMLGHLTIAGMVEVIFTVGVLTYIKQTSAAVLYETHKKAERTKKIWIPLLAMIVAVPLGLLASGTAWGEWGVDEIDSTLAGGKVLGYTPSGMLHGFSFHAIFADYSIAGIPEWLGYILSAIIGMTIMIIIFKVVRFKKKREDPFTDAL